jgi:hypothetical protein
MYIVSWAQTSCPHAHSVLGLELIDSRSCSELPPPSKTIPRCDQHLSNPISCSVENKTVRVVLIHHPPEEIRKMGLTQQPSSIMLHAWHQEGQVQALLKGFTTNAGPENVAWGWTIEERENPNKIRCYKLGSPAKVDAQTLGRRQSQSHQLGREGEDHRTRCEQVAGLPR